MFKRLFLHLTYGLSLSGKCLRLANTIWIKVRLFSDSDNPIPKALSNVFVVKCGGVESTTIIPNSCLLVSLD